MQTPIATLCVSLGLAIASAASAAQTPRNDPSPSRFDISVGITMNTPEDVNQRPLCVTMGLPCQTPRTFPDFGLASQVAVYPVEHIAVVAEASVYVNHWDTLAVNPVDEPRFNHARAILVGPRLTTGVIHLGSGDELGVRAFGQMLAGREASTILAPRTALQPGAGVDARLSYPATWIRVSADYRSTRGGPRNLSGSRVMAALVVAP